jgi:hypothetical protein
LRAGLAVFVVLFTARLSLAMFCATQLPFYDEWSAVIDAIARPLLAHRFDPAVLLATHNEHVLAPSRLLELVLLWANDMQFDNTLVVVTNQFFYAATSAALIVLALPAFAARPRMFVATATLYACLPYDWENIGMGLANSYVFLTLFSVATILVCARVRRGVPGGTAIVACALAAAVSMGGGFLAALVGLVVIALRWRHRDLSSPIAMSLGIALIACATVGVALTWHATVMPRPGIWQCVQMAIALLLWFPAIAFGTHIARTGAMRRCDLPLLGVALWGLLEVLAMIAARPEFRLWLPISRYMEILSVAAFANLACALRLAEPVPALQGFARAALPGIALAIALAAPYAFAWFDWRAANLVAQAQRIQRYVQAHDMGAIVAAPSVELAHPDRNYLRRELDAADVRYLLGDTYGTRPKPAPLTVALRTIESDLRTLRYALWPCAALLALLLLPASWRQRDPGGKGRGRRCATIDA